MIQLMTPPPDICAAIRAFAIGWPQFQIWSPATTESSPQLQPPSNRPIKAPTLQHPQVLRNKGKFQDVEQ